MEKLTYKQAYDKIIQAYFKDEIKPFLRTFCFCGTLAPNNDWHNQNTRNIYPYSVEEYSKMEYALMIGFIKEGFIRVSPFGTGWVTFIVPENKIIEMPNYEDALFLGMSAALEVLKEIHRARGEDVDAPVFTKRELSPPAH